MSDKLTDNEIIKALECCRDGSGTGLIKATIDLINRQKAEIERLNKKVEELSEVLSDTIRIRYAECRAEAIKEFAERLKDYLRQQPQWYVIRENYKNVGFSYDDVFFGIEKVVKKITEANNE